MSDRLPAPIRPDATRLLAHIGERVHQRRTALGLTITEVATHARLEHNTLMAVEAPGGQALPTWQLVRLAQALRLTLTDLLGDDPLPPVGHVRWETLP